MGKKRKKSKGAKKKRRQRKKAAGKASSSTADEPRSNRRNEGVHEEVDESGDEDTEEDGAGEPVADETAGESCAGDAAGESGEGADPPAQDAAQDDDDDAPLPEHDAHADENDAQADEDLGQPDDDDNTPLIGRDALLALSEFRDEGVATIPEELVLDLGEAAAAEERDRLLAAALAHVEMQDAIYRVAVDSRTARRWKGLIGAAVFVMAIFLAGLPPSFLVPEPPPPLTTGERLGGIRMALLVQAEQVDAFQVREGRLPTSLVEVETALPAIRFVRSSNRLYQLVAYTPDGEAVVYDSASPDPAFSDVTASWTDRENES